MTIRLQWQKCYDILNENSIEYFVTKKRSHLVVKKFIDRFEKPYVRLINFPAKVEVVKENIRDFEDWLMR